MSERPENYICPDCGLESEPISLGFAGRWMSRTSCPVCSERRRKQEEQGAIVLQIDSMTADLGEILVSRGISEMFINASLEQFTGTKQRLHEGPKGIFMSGPCGTGKTHYMAAVMRKLSLDILAKGKESMRVPHEGMFPLFVSFPDLLSMIRATFNSRTQENEASLIDRYCECDTVFFDDVGAGHITPWGMSIIFLIVDRRYREMKKTFFTSNLTIGELSRELDDRIASRIAGMSRPINLTGADRRLQG